MTFLRAPLAVWLVLSLAALPLAAQTQEANPDYFAPENILRFAQFLYDSGDYLRAAGEFQRYLYCNPSLPGDFPAVAFKIGSCYLKAKDFSNAVSWFGKNVGEGQGGEFADASRFQVAYAYFLDGQYDRSLQYIAAESPQMQGQKERLDMKQLQGLNFFYQKKWGAAASHFGSLEKEGAGTLFTAQFLQLSRQGEAMKRKSKWLAGLMSAAIPGLGKVYTKKPLEGLLSLTTVGANVWLSYQNFRSDGVDSVRGWIYGAMALFFYVGSIYGSVASANVFNLKLENALFKDMGISIGLCFK